MPDRARRSADAATSAMSGALADGKRKAAGSRPRPVGVRAVLALQRSAGNSAVGALMAAKLRSPGSEGGADIDAALSEVRRDDPAIDTVEKGLKAARAVGIPVDLEGPKPPASALVVTTTGFGPGSVAEKKAVPAPKPVPAVNPLGKAAARSPHAPAGGGATSGQAPPSPEVDAADASMTTPAPLSADQLLQEPVPPAGVLPHDDPAFTGVTGHVAGHARAKKAHPPAASKAHEAQAAALAPTGDIPGQAKAAKVDAMDAQQAGSFDKKAFIAAVKTAIEAKSPKTLTEADDYKDSGKAGEVKGDVKGLVTSGKEGQAKDIETATDAPPDESKAVAKQVTPMGPEEPGRTAAIPAAGAVPKPAPPEQLNLEAGKQQADREMSDGQVSEQQLADSNEPEFQQAVADKHAAAAHADTAPGEFRQHEADTIDQGKAEASAETTAAVDGIHGSKVAALAHLVADKGKTKSKDEAKRAEVTTKIQGIFAATEADVKKILDGIDPKVEAAFDKGEAGARAAFESYVDVKMSAYKEDRYSGWLGGLRWAKDKLRGMPDKVNEFYEAGREIYLKRMDDVISGVADIVGADLTAAKTRIASGRAEIASYVKSLPEDLAKVGAEASAEIGDKFEQLEDDVNSKQKSVVDTLATKYTTARKGLDDRIEELQAENKGLVDRAIGAIKAVINTIRELAAMLMNALARVAGVVGDIIKHPVKFLGNLVEGVKGGILKFRDTIVDHLRKGLMSWLFGALGNAGVEIPDTADAKGIIKLLGSIFGLTWANIRDRIVRKIGEKAMAAAERGVEIFQVIAHEGVGGLWQMLVEKLGDIKEMILEQVKGFVVTEIINAGIQWLIGLLNPAAAFVKACKLIFDIIMFFVTNAERIKEFVNTVIDSVADMVRGNVSAVIDKVDDALGKMVPILIGFLANLVNLGGIGEKVREIVGKLQKPVTKAVDLVVDTGLKLAGPIIRGARGVSGRVKAKVAAGKAWAKGKVEAGKAFVRGTAASARNRSVDAPVAGQGPLSGVAAAREHMIKRLGVKRPVTMRGHTHSVYTVFAGGRPKVIIASSPEVALGRLEIALAHPSVRAHPPTVALLKALRTDLVRLQDEMETAFARSSMPEIRAAEDNLTSHVGNVISVLSTVGEAFDITDLKGTQWTTPDGEIRPELRQKGRLRRIFYGAGYQQHTGALLTQAHDTKRAMAARFNANPMFEQQSYYCPGVPGEIPPHLALDRDGVQADHKKPVAWHWNEIGRKGKHDVRVGWDSDINNLQALCPTCNRLKSSMDDEGVRVKYNPKVEPGFEGPQ